MRALFIQNCELEGPALVGEWLAARDVVCDVVHPYRGDALPPAGGYDLFVVGGTPRSANELRGGPEWRYLADVVAAGRPYLGLCAGAQLLALLLGAEVRRNPVLEIGVYDVRRTGDDPLLEGFPETFPVFQWHGETFDVPAGATLLAEGDDCRNQAFRSGGAVGLQFHLEVTANEAAAWCDAYANELRALGKTKAQVVDECGRAEPAMRVLGERLLDRWLEG